MSFGSFVEPRVGSWLFPERVQVAWEEDHYAYRWLCPSFADA
jgi:hypothetical protein